MENQSEHQIKEYYYKLIEAKGNKGMSDTKRTLFLRRYRENEKLKREEKTTWKYVHLLFGQLAG